jgi:sulfite reductase (NADPH) flavoprotein alpha-component
MAVPGDGLSPEQWRLVQQLSRSLDPAQARWISGYFAGLAAAPLARAGQAEGGAGGRRLTILYGTETGNAAGIARALAEAAGARGLSPQLADMADYKVRQFGQEQDLLLIVSTHGDGDPPQPAAGFFEFIEGRKAPRLGALRFAVLSLGDSTYEYYCEAGKRLDRRLEELGAARLLARVDCDVDFDEPAAAWRQTVLDQLGPPAAGRPAAPACAATRGAAALYDRRTPFIATVLENLPIVGRGSTRQTRHIELSLAGSGLAYQPGDALGIIATNDPRCVSALLDALGFSSDDGVEVGGEALRLGQALADRLEITTATPRFLESWAQLSKAAELTQLLSDDASADRLTFLKAHHVIDIVRGFPAAGVTPSKLVRALRPLQPRLYSICSSLAATPDEAHLTVAPVRYALHGEPRAGVASGMLADRAAPDTVLPVYVQENRHFRLPADDVPIVLIGAGTGIAPYRAFLQEREARGAPGRSWLFFGERNFRTDFLYQAEWQAWLRDGALSRMEVAFSRDQDAKLYVQHRMRERSRDLFAWLQDGAHVYVCGDAARLAPDVHEALIATVETEAGLGRDAAEDYVRRLLAEQRYHRDVY